MNRTTLTLIASLVFVSLSGCKTNDAKSAWSSVLSKCSITDLNGKTILYFGPSNNVGPGSVWRAADQGGYRLRYDLADMPGETSFIQPGTPSSCDGTSTTSFDLKTSAGFTSELTPISFDLANDLKKAKSVDVKAGSISWDLVREGPYEQYIKSLPASGGVREDLSKANRLILYRALKVTGFTAVLQFSDSDAVSLKGKYSGVLPKELTGSVGAELSTSWSTDNKLTLVSTSPFYIAGELVQFNTDGFAAEGASRLGQPIKSSGIQSIGVETPNSH